MTKPALYAALLVACAGPVLAQPAGPPCGACLVPMVTPADVRALPAGALQGLTTIVTAGGEPPAAVAADVLRAGGRPGVLLEASRVTAGMAFGDAAAVVLQAPDAAADVDVLAFELKTRLTAARAAAPEARLGLRAPSALLRALGGRDLASYVDFAVSDAAVDGLEVWLETAASTLDAALDATRTPGQRVWTTAEPAAVVELASAARWLPEGLVPHPDVRVRCAGVPMDTFLNPGSLDAVALGVCAPDAIVDVAPPHTGMTRHRLGGRAVVVVPAPAGERVASGVEVVGARALTVEEVVARHQAAAARQAARIGTSIARGTLTLTFEAPGFPAPVTISSLTTVYTGEGRVELAQERIRVNGIAFGGGTPRLPIIEPERAASPPLVIALTDVYRYRLRGRETLRVAGTRVDCYVVSFEPRGGADGSLFAGTAWIAADDFGLARVQAAQTNLRGAIVASEQTDDYRRADDGLWLLARSDVRQMYEGAAHRTPIHRVLAIEAYDVNPRDFAARRAAAYASAAVMLRDTPEGYRYLRREAPRAGAGGETPAGSIPPVEPVVEERASRVRTFVGGVIIDPNISVPLPFAGLSYVDFDLWGTGAQLNAFFGGSYGQLAFSIPSLGRTKWQMAGRAFGIASSYNDRAFVDGREQYARNIRQRPAHASAWFLRPLSPRIVVRAGYEFDYTRFAAADVTAASFVVPANAAVHGARLAVDAQRGGWNASAWWNPAVRQGWRAWGEPGSGDYAPAHRAFVRYGVSASRATVLSPGVAARLEGAWMGGRDLDRFSRYAFGTFDNRLRGYPSALVRYDRGGVVRGALAWSVARVARLDLFLDSAQVRDPGFGRGFRNYTGMGAALEAPAPFGLLVTAEWGYGFRGVDADGGRGTHVIRLSAFKVF